MTGWFGVCFQKACIVNGKIPVGLRQSEGPGKILNGERQRRTGAGRGHRLLSLEIKSTPQNQGPEALFFMPFLITTEGPEEFGDNF